MYLNFARRGQLGTYAIDLAEISDKKSARCEMVLFIFRGWLYDSHKRVNAKNQVGK